MGPTLEASFESAPAELVLGVPGKPALEALVEPGLGPSVELTLGAPP